MHNVETPVFQSITIDYEKESFPHNLSLDVNADGHDEWSWPGKFNTTYTLNESTMGLATILMGIVPRTGTGNFTVPMKFTSDKPGILRVYGLNITGNYRPEVIQTIPEISMIENVPRLNVFNVTNYFRHLDEDRLVYTTVGNWNILINISENGTVDMTSRTGWYGEERFTLRATDSFGEYADLPIEVDVTHVIQAPTFTLALPGINITEGDTVRSAFNLFDYVFDPDTPKTALIFSVADITNGNVSVDMDINQNVNIYSKSGWYGNATVKMKVSDGELSAYASFNVRVEHVAQPPPVNQPPTLDILPPLQMVESTQMDHAFNLFNFTSDPDTPLSNITFRIETVTEPKAGVTIGADGWVNIRPDKKWSGISFIVINASDGKDSGKSSFTVTVTAKPVASVTENNGPMLMAIYGLIALVLVLLVVLAVDITVRTSKKRPGRPQEQAAAGAEASRAEQRPPSKEGGEVPPIPIKRTLKEAPQVPAQAPQGEITVQQEIYGAPAEAPAETAGEVPPIPTVVVAEQTRIGSEPVGPGEPPVSVLDLTPPAEMAAGEHAGPSGAEAPAVTEAPPENAPGAGQDVQGEPAATTGLEIPAGQEYPVGQQGVAEPPAETEVPTYVMEPSAGQPAPEEPGQAPSGKSAVSLLVELQMAKTTANGMEGQAESGEQPAAPEAEPPSPEGVAPAQSAVQPPATEIEPQEVSAEPGQAPGPAEGGQPAAEGESSQKPVTRVRCTGCKAAIPVFSAQRPLVVTCPQCGRMGMLK